MKKFVFTICLALLCASAFAGNLFSFDTVSQTPLYREAFADPYAFNTKLHIFQVSDPDLKPNRVYSIIAERTSGTETYGVFYDYLPISDTMDDPQNTRYFNMKTGVSLGLMHLRFNGYKLIPSVDAQINLGGYINTIFCMFGANDTLAFDGSYFLGASVRFADILSVRFGMHHFSGHYGDEMLVDYFETNKVNASEQFKSGSLFEYAKAKDGKDYYLINPVEYVRDNSWLLGVSADLPSKSRLSVRVYGEAELPQDPSWFRPFVHVPAGYTSPSDPNQSLIDKIGGSESFPQDQLDEEQQVKEAGLGTYKGWRIHTGIEMRYNLGFCALFVAGDVQYHQDGQTKHTPGAYSPDNPWEIEYTVGGGVELGKVSSGGKTVRIEAYYHDGRTPSTQWFYQRTKYVTVGLGLN